MARGVPATHWTWPPALVGVVVGMIIVTRRHRQTSLRMKRLSWFIVILSAGVVYGMLRGAQAPTRLDALVGVPVQAWGQVGKVQSYPFGASVELTLNHVQSDGGSRNCQLRVSWWMRGHTAAVAGITAGDAVVLRGLLVTPPLVNSRGQPIRSRLAQAGIYYEFDGSLITITAAAPTALDTLRSLIDHDVRRALPRQTSVAPLLESIVFGGSSVAAGTSQAFLQAGLLHVLAASGANVLLLNRVLSALVKPVWRLARLPSLGWTLCQIGFLWGFSGLCGFAPSIVRAACMAGYREVGQALGRRPNIGYSLAVTALILAIGDPALLTQPGSILSFAATAAIARCLQRTPGPRPTNRWTVSRLWDAARGHLWSILRMTAMVELYVTPLTVALFGQVTPYAMVSNLLAEPILLFLLPISALFMVLAAGAAHLPLLVPGTELLGQVAAALLSILLRWVNTVASWPDSLLYVHLSVPAIGGYYIALWITPRLLRGARLPSSTQASVDAQEEADI